MSEQIDIVTDLNQPTGTTADKREAHRQGLWHRTFSALALALPRRSVLLQIKSPNRIPGGPPAQPIADFTVGGHYRAGEPTTSVREVDEEFGRKIAYTDLHPIGIRQTVATLSDTYIEREFQYWHLLPIEDDLAAIRIEDDEVVGLVEVGIDEAIRLADGSDTSVPALWGHRAADGLLVTEGTLDTANLVRNFLGTDQIYLRLFLAAHRYHAGERTHLFW
ncbi:NUDIX domain-containing protein [Amycolatopsis sp. OK19-0408]|uniref:NUDIX domain-containing protein n=1 Tax=Amycolatopsis iheyensis TaxID=2945988 RepID=A0A9X2SQB2_9PSEU|nr:NUDIX domain-containing protein [Amycolatopsis iheyensis]MCR6488350.1 NUDIX domain-containing protein [Amycolatopsis iheyensis]